MAGAFPYSEFEIEALVEAEKHPRDWESISFQSYGGSKTSLRADVRLEMSDGRYARFRFGVRAPVVNDPLTYASVLLLEDTKVRGIDYHEIGRARKYGVESIPKGWHEDIVNPNLDDPYNKKQKRRAIADFAPYHLEDFTAKVAAMWNIVLPENNKYLL